MISASHVPHVALLVLKIIGIGLGLLVALALFIILGLIILIGTSNDNPFR
jgi:hypothetical protein